MHDLFDGIGAYRWNDPDTSKDAAESVDATKLEGIVTDTLAAHPEGLTVEEIVNICGILMVSISPRMKPLEEKEKVIRTDKRRPGASGKGRIVWKLAPPKGNNANEQAKAQC